MKKAPLLRRAALKKYQTTKMFKKNIKNGTKIGYGPLFCQNKKEGEQKRGDKLTN